MAVGARGAGSAIAELPRLTLVSQVRIHAEGLADRLRGVERLKNVRLAQVEDCTQSQLGRVRPHLLLIDSSSVPIATLEQLLGTSAAVLLAEGVPDPRLVAYGLAVRDEESVLRLLSLGAMGFILSDAPFDALVETVLDVLAGQVRCPPEVARILIRRAGDLVRISAHVERFDGLTRREREALNLAMAGQQNKEIAARMGVTVATVRTELHSAYQKLGVESREDAARLVYRGVVKSDVRPITEPQPQSS